MKSHDLGVGNRIMETLEQIRGRLGARPLGRSSDLGPCGLVSFDLVATLFGGPQAALSRIIYGVVGVSGLYQIEPDAANY
jgi:hypothetical protein